MSATADWTSSSAGVLELVAAFARQDNSGFDSALFVATRAISLGYELSSSIAASIRKSEPRMAFFKEAPIKGLTRDRDNAKANVDRLALKLHDAEANVIATKSLAQRAALDGDDGGLDAAEAAERAALHRHGTLSAAHAESEKLLALLESQLETMADQKLRAATSVATLALADELVEIGAAFEASTIALNEVAGRVLLISAEGNGLAVFTSSAKVEVAAAVEVLAMVLHEHSRAVLNHQAAAAMPKPAPVPAKPVPVVKEPLTLVFATKAVRWLDQDGKPRSSGKYLDVELPVKAAARALAIGAALPIDHPERKKNRGQWPGNYNLASAVDLDSDASAPQHDPVKHGAFVETIGAPRLMRVGGTS
jgi:hypothetical protein